MGRKKVDPAERKRLNPAERREQLLNEAYAQADANGLENINRLTVGTACGVTDGLVSRYFGTLSGLRDAVVAVAIQQANLGVVASALELGYPRSHFPKKLLKQFA